MAETGMAWHGRERKKTGGEERMEKKKWHGSGMAWQEREEMAWQRRRLQ
ncbi:hypothetical protein [Mycobacterium sp. 48b]